MGKDSSITLMAFGIMASAVILDAMVFSGFGPISFLYMILFVYVLGYSLIKGIYGLHKLKSEKNTNAVSQKEREAAMIMAWIPGLGQAYMGEFKKRHSSIKHIHIGYCLHNN